MTIEDVNKIIDNVENKPNKDLLEAREVLISEFTETKELIIQLTLYLEKIESFYEKINNEIKYRLK